MVCNMKPAMFGNPSMEVIKHSCIKVDVNFIGVIGRTVSGSSVKCSHMKQIQFVQFIRQIKFTIILQIVFFIIYFFISR